MSQGLPSGYILPTPQRAKLVGMLNIGFASLVLIMMALQGVMYFVSPMLMKMSNDMIKEGQAKVEQRRKDQAASLKLEAAAAKTAEEKAELNRRIAALESNAAPSMPDLAKVAEEMNTPAIQVYGWSSFATGVALNLAMLISGIGLLRFKERSRRLAIWTFGLKIARLCLMTAFTVIVIIPLSSKMSADIAAGVAPRGPGPIPFVFTAQFQAIISTAITVLTLVFGCIWPIVGVVLLTRPGTRAACRMPASKPVVGELDLP